MLLVCEVVVVVVVVEEMSTTVGGFYRLMWAEVAMAVRGERSEKTTVV